MGASLSGSASVAGVTVSGSIGIGGKPSGPSMGGSLAKAEILFVGSQGGGSLVCMFNPSEYTVTRSADWGAIATTGGGQTATSQPKLNVPPIEFKGIKETTMNLELFFDSTLDGGYDVRVTTAPLWRTVTVANPGTINAKAPPEIIFRWGLHSSFQAAVLSVSQKFLLFNEKGDCLRSTVTLSLKESLDKGIKMGTNPTSYGKSGNLHTVCEGDRLDLIAAKAYNKPGLWRHIAEYNGINNPRDLVPGRKLIIPPLP